MVVLQEPAEPLATLDRAHRSANLRPGLDDLVPEPLMVALRMEMRQEFGDSVPQRFLAEQDYLVERFFLDRTQKAFKMGIAVSA